MKPFLLIITWPILVYLVGLAIWCWAKPAKVNEQGKMLVFIALFMLCTGLGTQVVHFF